MSAVCERLVHLTLEEKGGLKRKFTVEVPAAATVQAVREVLSPLCKGKLAGILLFDGEDYLQNHVTLDAYEIADGAHLYFETRMCGVLPANHDWSKSGLKTKQTRFAF